MNTPAMSPDRLKVLVSTATRPEPAAQLVAGVGSTVEAEDIQTGGRMTYRLVEAHDAAPGQGLLSIDSPVGLALQGRSAGDTTTAGTPRGPRRLRILSVS